jgi:hypothetical protein
MNIEQLKKQVAFLRTQIITMENTDYLGWNGIQELTKAQSELRKIEGEIESMMPKNMTEEENAAYFGLIAAMNLAHKTATDAGWYVDPVTGQPVERNFGEVVALMHSELSEALEADRKGLMDDKLPHRPGQEVEFGDCVIRIMDTSAARGYDIAGAFIEKNRINQTRADHKLENRSQVGGKKY